MTVWYKAINTSNGSFIACISDSTNTRILHLSVGPNNKLRLGLRKNDGNYVLLIETSELVANNSWNFTAVKWQYDGSLLNCAMFMNGTKYSASISDFKDFSGTTTSIGAIFTGEYPLNGQLEQFSNSKDCLSDSDILAIYNKGRDALNIKSTATYTTNGNYIDKVTDGQGHIVDYNYNETKGTLDSIVDPNGKITTYSYDDRLDRLSTVTKGIDNATANATNSYTYDKDRLKTITHNADGGSSVSYTFEYDDLGNNTGVKVGNQSLITNTYEARTSKLLESTYGNNQKVSYDYDNLDRVTAKKIDNVIKFKYEYDSSGNLGYVEDVVNGVSYRYVYDLADRLVKVVDSNGNVVDYGYDLNNNVSTFTETIRSNKYTTGYEYDKDNRAKKVTGNNGSYTSYNYDSIGRLQTKTVDTGLYQFATEYQFEAGNTSNVTSNKLSTITNKGNPINYEYDANGNITLIEQEAIGNNLLYNSSFTFGTKGWVGIDSVKPDAAYGNVAYRNVVNGQLMITQALIVPHGTYGMSAILKSSNYNALSGVGFVFYYTDGTYSDYTWTGNNITDLGNGYRLYEKTGSSNTSKTISWVEVRVWSGVGQTLDVTIARTRFFNTRNTELQSSQVNYKYNELNELIREDNQILNKSITYRYDEGGNLLEKVEYPYSTGELGTSIKTYSYTYEDANWKDKLTKFDGKSIGYDNIGNLTSYNGYSYVWEAGRQLTVISKPATDTEPGFNASFKVV
jgi:YD repeat-containing protein